VNIHISTSSFLYLDDVERHIYNLDREHDNLAWVNAKSSSLWNPPLPGTVKANFDVAVKSNFAGAAMILSGGSNLVILSRRLLNASLPQIQL
jgi:hypothetical protein